MVANMEVMAFGLCYHGFTDHAPAATLKMMREGTLDPKANIENFQGKHVTVADFRKQMEAIHRRGSQVVTLSEMVDRLHHPSLELAASPYVNISIDDSYKGILKILPVLEDFGYPATIFIATIFIGTTLMYWTDQVEHMVNRTREKFVMIEDPFHGVLCYELATAQMKMHAVMELKRYIKTLNPQMQKIVLKQIEAQLGLPDHTGVENYGHLDEDDIRRLHAHPLITLGGHTDTHPVLPTMSAEEQEREIVTSLNKLQQMTGTMPDLFSYPEGLSNQTTEDLLKKHGIKISPTASPGANRRFADPFKLKRNMVDFNEEPLPL